MTNNDDDLVYCPLSPDVVCQLAFEARKHKTRYESIIDNSFEEIYIIDEETLLFVDVSRGAVSNIGYSLEELKQMKPIDIDAALSETVCRLIFDSLSSGSEEIAKFQSKHQRKDGSRYDVDVRLQYIPGNEPVFIAMVTDITERKRYEEELKALAFRDPGTDLYNRRYFMEQLEGTINHINRMSSKLSLILIDMDDFSEVNNKYGHLAGDKIIGNFADKIRDVFSRKTDIVARYGGDEFIVMCIDTDENHLITKCLELRDLFNIPYIYEGNEITQTASIGICTIDGANELIESEELFKGADQAMYSAKELGKNTVKVCDR